MTKRCMFAIIAIATAAATIPSHGQDGTFYTVVPSPAPVLVARDMNALSSLSQLAMSGVALNSPPDEDARIAPLIACRLAEGEEVVLLASHTPIEMFPGEEILVIAGPNKGCHGFIQRTSLQ